jgi:predicted phage terminase large subunit-like protein
VLTAEQWDETAYLERELARRELLAFTRYTARDYQVAWFHERLAAELDAVLSGRTKRLIVNMPPQNGKSELVSRRFPAFALGRNPNLRIIHGSYNADLARDMSRDVKRVIATQEYRRLFPQVRLGTAKDPEVNMADQFDVVGTEGSYRAAGVGQGIAGKSMLLGIIDDPIKSRAEGESEAYRRLVWNWYVSDFRTRSMGDQTAIVLVQTRWHEDDLAGRLISLAKRDPMAEQWRVVSFPALIETTDQIQPGDPRGLGEALWPSRFSRQWLLQTKATSGLYDWCTPSETPILMGDFTSKRIIDVKPGDVVMGFVKRQTRRGRRELRPAKVLATGSRRAVVCDISMASGRPVRCTKEHRWFNGRWYRKTPYRPASIGGSLHFAAEPFDTCSDSERLLWAYLAGIVDGEGSVGRSVLVITQGLDRNKPIYDEIIRVCSALGLRFYERKKLASSGHYIGTIVVCDAASVYRKLIRFTNTAKRAQMILALTRYGAGRNERGKDTVLSITEGREEDVFSLQTETGNYIAWGYLSSNSSLYQQTPVPAGGAMAKRAWFKVGRPMGTPLRRCRCWDLAGTKPVAGRDPDWTVGALIGQYTGGDWCVEHILRIRDTAHHVDALMLQTAAADGRRVLVREWQDPGAAGKSVIENHRVMLTGYDYEPLPSSGEKSMRWRPFFVQAEGGHVYIAPGAWNTEFLDEMQVVPYGAHDDQADASAGGFNALVEHKSFGPSAAAVLPGSTTASGPSSDDWRNAFFRR